MKTITICLIAAFFVAGTTHSSAQIRLGAVSSARLNTSAGIHSPGLGNALRSTTNSGISTTNRIKAGTTARTEATAQKTVSTTKQAESKTVQTAQTTRQTSTEVQAGATVQAQKQ